ncbi:TadE/TadG family type IV pilus assembly protein [Massilia sp. DWR3-1-1]|uniref:TadE/TadG family type IV pilus assembly protein n=1 Tax=Massilia sp. DWR3-1-1 TaxID=2804559 RepID=UPI003CEEA8C0
MIIPTNRRRQGQGGVASVEFALVLPVITILLAVTLFFGRLFWHYTVALKAASDMATFIALSSKAEMTESNAALGEIEIVKLARAIGEAELAELSPGNNARPIIDITCDGGTCRGDSTPDALVVMVKMRMYDPILRDIRVRIGPTQGLLLHAEVRVRYAGL